MSGPDLDHAVLDHDARRVLEQSEVYVLAERQHQRVGLQRLELAGRLGEAGLVELHLLDDHRAALDRLDGGEPFHRDALLQRLLELEIVRRHFLARAAIDDNRLGGAEPAGGAGGVERGVAAAVDDDFAAEQRRPLALHRAQEAHRVEDPRRPAGRDIGAPGDMGPDGEERRVEAAPAHGGFDVVDLGIEDELDPHRHNAPDLGVEHVARQAIFGDAEAHHTAGQRPSLADRHPMAEAPQMIGGGEARRSGADDEHALARFALRLVERPAFGDRDVAEEPLDRIDADRLVDLGAVAGGFARVIADAAHHGGQRIVFGQGAPGVLVLAGLGMG